MPRVLDTHIRTFHGTGAFGGERNVRILTYRRLPHFLMLVWVFVLSHINLPVSRALRDERSYRITWTSADDRKERSESRKFFSMVPLNISCERKNW